MVALGPKYILYRYMDPEGLQGEPTGTEISKISRTKIVTCMGILECSQQNIGPRPKL